MKKLVVIETMGDDHYFMTTKLSVQTGLYFVGFLIAFEAYKTPKNKIS